MTRIPNSLVPASRFGFSVPQFYFVLGAASLGSLCFLQSISRSSKLDPRKTIASPRETVISHLSEEEVTKLPYPPDALPGARDVASPYGSIRVYEWGPEDGERILLIHGISTPSIALTDLAYKLVEKGCRVMLFDLFGRGYSSAPDPQTYRYDSALYTSQIFLCLQSSPVSWSSFTMIGYSLGGALAADFASYFPNLIRGLILVATGGLIRTSHVSWKSKLLYQSGGWIPEWLVENMVAKRLWTGPEAARSIEPEPDTVENAETSKSSGRESRSNAVYQSSHHTLLPGNPDSTVSAVVDWQIQHHKGFVPAFISSIRYAPIHEQHHRWKVIKENIERNKGLLREVWLVLGETDSIIISSELTEDAKSVLGEENVKVEIVKGSGHEVAVERADDIVDVVRRALVRNE